MLNDLFHTLCYSVVFILALTTDNPVYLISTKGARGCDRSTEDAYSSAAPDPTFAVFGRPCCPKLDFVFAFWTLITFYTLLTSLFDIYKKAALDVYYMLLINITKCTFEHNAINSISYDCLPQVQNEYLLF
jgi:hypothetical protein